MSGPTAPRSITSPVLTCAESRAREERLLEGDPGKAWQAMARAGRAIGRAMLRDLAETGPLPEAPRLLVLAGKGNNAGDAFLAAREMVLERPGSQVAILFSPGSQNSSIQARRALGLLEQSLRPGALTLIRFGQAGREQAEATTWEIVLDGLLGMAFRPPLRPPLDQLIAWANRALRARVRVAVDLPSGIADDSAEEPFRADFTYAAGIAKAPLFEPANLPYTGRVRYCDIGFFEGDRPCAEESPPARREILVASTLDPLRGLRPATTDKRGQGHLFLLGGTRRTPGAIQMAVRAALQSGAGLVTAAVPESRAPHFAAVLPEAMWLPWPETVAGGLDPDAADVFGDPFERATALAAGPGIGREPAVRELLARLVRENPSLPMVIDAEGIVPEVVEAVARRGNQAAPVVLTPHAGEFQRVAAAGEDPDERGLRAFCQRTGTIVLLKGPVSRLAHPDGRLWLSPFGGPILARGGSGDILTGLVGSLMARPGADAFEATATALVWHGLAADWLARREGAEAVRTTQLLDALAPALREEAGA